MQQHILLLLLIVSLLQITTSTLYHVMPDDHYHPINDNTYTLQHYLNNTNKYFTSNTQLHFLPGQYYLYNDLIIQGISNFSLIGNRIGEVINTVINCTSPAGIAVVRSSNIVIANIVMNKCGNNFEWFIPGNKTLGNTTKTLFVFHCNSVTITCFHSIWHGKLCGIEFVNGFESKISHLISNYLHVWYLGTSIGSSIPSNSIDKLYIKNFQANSVINNVYTIQIEWHNTNFNFSARLLNINFTQDLTLHVAFTKCLGKNAITVGNCSFSSMKNYAYTMVHEDNKTVGKCNGNCDEKILIEYVNINRTSHDACRIYFTDCYFTKLLRKSKILHYKLINYSNKKQLLFINNCIFYGNQNTHLILAQAQCNKNFISKDCACISITNTQILSNTLDKFDLIFIENVILNLKDVKFINNHVSIFIIYTLSKLFTYKYNEFSKNYAIEAIRAKAIYICENSMLNITLNNFDKYFISSLEAPQGIDNCAIQYISGQGNLDKMFQVGKAINYSIIFNSNNMKKISNIDLEHCEWDSSSAFQTSRSAHVNHHFIHTQHNNFYSCKPHERTLCLCNQNMSVDCYTEELGPFYPDETVSFTLISVIEDTVILDKCQYSHIVCKNYNFKSIHLPYQTCKSIKLHYYS